KRMSAREGRLRITISRRPRQLLLWINYGDHITSAGRAAEEEGFGSQTIDGGGGANAPQVIILVDIPSGGNVGFMGNRDLRPRTQRVVLRFFEDEARLRRISAEAV